MVRALRDAAIGGAAALAAMGQAGAQIAPVKPEAAGVSSAGVAAIEAEMRGLVEQKKLAGYVTVLSRHGQVVMFDTYGKKDLALSESVKPDTIWRLASMTKPVTGVAMMQLYEQGKWKLDDPVSKFIPEFANLKVKTKDGALVPMAEPMTMAMLLSHTDGFPFASGLDPDIHDLDELIAKLAKEPLAAQPGTAWAYGQSVNIQGYLIEKLSGQRYDDYIRDHIFKPLKMVDTDMWVDPAKLPRLSDAWFYDDAGHIIPDAKPYTFTSRPRYMLASGGLFSTARDYWRFCQMLAGGGELDGVRLLKPETVKLMRKNQMRPGVKINVLGPNADGIGFGLNFAVLEKPNDTGLGLDSYWWGGAYGTWFWIDPTNDVVFVGMIQSRGKTAPEMSKISQTLVYKALIPGK